MKSDHSNTITFAITVASIFGYLSINRICNMFEKLYEIKYSDYNYSEDDEEEENEDEENEDEEEN